MPKFQALVRGVNFRMQRSDAKGTERLGFYTNVFVEADTAQAVEGMVIEMLRGDARIQEATLNSHDDPPMLFVEEVCEIGDWPVDAARPRTGLALYNEDKSEETDEFDC